LLDEAKWITRALPPRCIGQGKTTPPNRIQETNGPGRGLLLLRGPAQQSVMRTFFPGTTDRGW
jgi:hypothetical protein